MPKKDEIKAGGVFVYDGEALDNETIPGVALKDKAGRFLSWKKEPKVLKKKIETYVLRGVEFPAGEKVTVEDTDLAHKLRGMPCFEEVETLKPVKKGKAKKGRRPAVEVDAGAEA